VIPANSSAAQVAEGPRRKSPSFKRWVVLVSAALLVLLIAPAVANLVICRIEQARHPVPGSFYQVDGRQMHIYCAGQGLPTVVLESELLDDWLDWQKVQPELAKTGRVCSYDRAGLGWSEPQDGPRDALHIAGQLHTLLQKAGETGPFILVGASAGGLFAREFTSIYRVDVRGIVFVDSATPEQIKALPGREDSNEKRRMRHHRATWRWIQETTGWARLSGRCKGAVVKGLELYAGLDAAEKCRPAYARSWLGEYDDVWRSAAEAGEARCCGDLLLVIVSRDPEKGRSADETVVEPIWNSLQENLKRLSSRSRRIIARGSGHDVMIDRPDVVINATRGIINEVRGNTSEAKYATTTVQ